MKYREEFEVKNGYDCFAYHEDENTTEPQVIGFCENYVEFLENKLKDLEHYKDSTIGLWATDREDLVQDPKKVLFQLK